MPDTFVPSDLIIDRCSITFSLDPQDLEFTRDHLLFQRVPIVGLRQNLRASYEYYQFHFSYPLDRGQRLNIQFGNRFPAAGALRIEWTPSKIGPIGLERLHRLLQTILRRPQHALDTARLTRVDLTRDVYGTRTPRLHVFANSAKFEWHATRHQGGRVVGCTVGKDGGARQLRYYDKANERRAKTGRSIPRTIRDHGRTLFPAWMRFEHELRHLGPLSQLATLRNPLEGFVVADSDRADQLARDEVERDFLRRCKFAGAQWALFTTWEDGRLRRRRLLQRAAVDWINAPDLWDQAVPAILRMLRVSYAPA